MAAAKSIGAIGLLPTRPLRDFNLWNAVTNLGRKNAYAEVNILNLVAGRGDMVIQSFFKGSDFKCAFRALSVRAADITAYKPANDGTSSAKSAHESQECCTYGLAA